jgi:Raf kinase inhibitor-like YbhB/YbcL family protein
VRTRRLVIAALLVALASACSHDGRTLRPPAPGQTLPPTTTPSTALPAGSQSGNTESQVDPASTMTLTSPAFADGGTIPDLYTCKGANVSPPLQWTGVPAGAAELAITVTDDDADGFVHWVLAGLAPDLTGIGEGAVPEGAVESVNGAHGEGWTGPCPPAGPAHHYVFTLYALSRASGLSPGASALQAIATVAGLQESAAHLDATYATS